MAIGSRRVSDKGDGVLCYLNLFIYFPYVHDGQGWFSGGYPLILGVFLFLLVNCVPLLFHPICPSSVAARFPFCLLYLPAYTVTRFTLYDSRVPVMFP